MTTQKIDTADLKIKILGECRFPSPLEALLSDGHHRVSFRGDEHKVLFEPLLSSPDSTAASKEPASALEIAGPRSKIYFEPAKTRVAIVTCGGLCPGINDVIRAIVMELHYRYGVKNILGIRYGYQGFIKKYNYAPILLTPEVVDDINTVGGTVLGTSRGRQGTGEIVDFLIEQKINVLFTIGGDGTLRGALELAAEIERRGLKISIIGIPKTVDNDIMYIDHSFGFETAFSEAAKFVRSAHLEAKASPNGVGIIKLMGRNSGFIACFAALAMTDVNFVLIPEIPFKLEGENGFLNALKRRLINRHHAVIVVAEGAGQDLLGGASPETDASGNPRLRDIGIFLKDKIQDFFKSAGMECNLKYIDPSYIIRSIPVSPYDSVYCLRLAQSAVHAAMSGRTEMVVGARHGYLVHLPMKLLAGQRQKIDPNGDWWRAVLSATGQPVNFR